MDTYMRKAWMKDSSLDSTTEGCHITINYCFSKACSKELCSCHRIERWSDTSLRLWLRLDAERGCRRRLSCCESIILIIEDNIGDIYISTTCMEKMSKPNSISISVTSNSDHGKVWIGKLRSDSKWYWATMKSFSRITIDILWDLSATTNTWHNNSIFTWYLEFFEGISDCHEC